MKRIQDDGMEHTAGPDPVRDAKRGDEAAFNSLLRPLLKAAYRLAAGMLQDRQLGEDAYRGSARAPSVDSRLLESPGPSSKFSLLW